MYIIQIFNNSQQKHKPFGIKIDIYLEATSVGKESIYMNHFYPLWIEHWGNPWPLITPKENKMNGVMISQGKSKLNPVEQFSDSDGMKIDRIHCLGDSE